MFFFKYGSILVEWLLYFREIILNFGHVVKQKMLFEDTSIVSSLFVSFKIFNF